MLKERAFSAPGKALLAGGYLVLDPQYRSYVVALSARMHAVVAETKSSGENWFMVRIVSAQFNCDEWNYRVSHSSKYEISEINGRVNPFAERALEVMVNYCQPDVQKMVDLVIELFSDAGYHSEGDSLIKRNHFRQFRFHNRTITEVPKTGLGSSAGLVVVLTASLLYAFRSEFDATSDLDKSTVHNLAQVAHCQAQGKVGSGFDVAAAVFGSIIYQRFDPKLIENLPTDQPSIYAQSLRHIIDMQWEFTHDNITLPRGIRLMMGDVNSGSETTKLVAKVRAWYESNYPKSLGIYQEINEGNLRFIDGIEKLSTLSQQDPSRYERLLEAVESDSNTKEIPEIAQIEAAVNKIRSNLQVITSESGADVEPPAQTKLLNSCSNLKGVITGVVPGAGGHDAICLLLSDGTDIVKQTSNNDTFSCVAWLDLHQENFGLKEEAPLYYKGLR
ncbi:LADA_0C05468g1_1 [Lachancea dasiensis]|uniref:Phosphomevalonate kinase n=1 Tax=Lachancea dasiensis TaxID=1072105 RepID=A0A1G4IZD0_9SACH|nr:LADA_0C05468g1_1 [Lachancea dasiensis]